MRTAAAVLAGMILITAAPKGLDGQSAPAGTTAAPRFQVDPSWPKEMPKLWILGAVTGVFPQPKHHFGADTLCSSTTRHNQELMPPGVANPRSDEPDYFGGAS